MVRHSIHLTPSVPARVFAAAHLEHKRNHGPSRLDRIDTKLFAIPPPRAHGRGPEVGHDKRQAAEHRPAEPPARRRGDKGNRQVDEALARVVRAHEELEQTRRGQRVLFEARQMRVAFILLDPGPKVNGHGGRHARGEDARGVLRLPRLKDGIWLGIQLAQINNTWHMRRHGNVPDPSIHILTLMAA